MGVSYMFGARNPTEGLEMFQNVGKKVAVHYHNVLYKSWHGVKIQIFGEYY